MNSKENPLFRQKDSLFLKAERLLELVKQQVPDADRHKVRNWLGRVANHYHYKETRKKAANKKYSMSNEESKVYTICIEQELNPWSCYKWFILLDAPSEIKELILIVL
jgi:hypothetical protein